MDVPISVSKLKWGLSLCAMCTVTGLLINLLHTSVAEGLEAIKRANIGYLVSALLLPLVDWLSTGSRLYLFVHLLDPKISWWACVKADLANAFAAAITPSQTGGGGAQIYVLVRHGMSVSAATIASFMSFVPTMIALGLMAFGVLLFQDVISFGMAGRVIMGYGVTAFGVVAGLVSLSLFLPSLSAKIILRAAHRYVRVRRNEKTEPPAWAQTLAGEVADCQRYMTYYLKHGKLILMVGIMLTVIAFVIRHVIAYVVLRGLGGEASLEQVLVVQSIIVFVSYLSPTPGGSGVVEVSTAVLMKRIMTPRLLPFFTILWRFATFYAGAILGGIFLIHAIHTPGNSRCLAESIIDSEEKDEPTYKT